MAALLKPQPAYDIVTGIKQACGRDVRVHVHVHATTGVTMVSLMKAIEAGADCVDTAISAISLGPGHNPTESLVEMLDGTGFDTRVDKDRLLSLKKYFATVRPRYTEFLSNITGVETEIFDSQIPGGMISNMESQLKQQGAADKMADVLAEVPRVRKDAGYPPLVTPSSQIVGTQAVFNVMMGRYKVLTGEFADLMLGYYGETIAERDPEVTRACRGAGQETRHHRASRRSAAARVAAVARHGARAQGLQRHRRGRADVCDVPAGRAEVLRAPVTRGRRISVGTEGGHGARGCATPAGARRRPGPRAITYEVTVERRDAQR